MVDNYSFSGYFVNDRKTYNLRQAALCTASGTIGSMKINPSGSSFAVLSTKGKSSKVAIYDLWTANNVLWEIKDEYTPCAICYSPDARTFAVAGTDKIYLYDTKQYRQQRVIATETASSAIAISGNNYFIAASAGDALNIYNIESGNLRKELLMGADINSFAFSEDGDMLIVATADGHVTFYDTKTFLPVQDFDAMGEARSCDIHSEGKYFAVVSGDNRIALINKLDNTDRRYIDNDKGGITDLRFVKDGKGTVYLLYNTSDAIVYSFVGSLTPYYARLLADELNERMSVWMKQMDGETLEEYHQRVNEETRMQQMRLFEQEIATRMADNLLMSSDITLGQFNTETDMLTINFDTMPSIYLTVPTDKVGDFMDTGDLEFRNALYGINENDRFELVYVDVYNKRSGETYTFDNRERRSLDYLRSDDNFVPLELVQMSNMDELRLREIRENIVSIAKRENRISDHTSIKVNAGVEADTDANGERIMNYKIGFSYEVEPAYSSREDFAPGKYLTEQSAAATSMIAIVKTAFESEFARYIRAGKKVRIAVTGMADRLPINGVIAYNGAYGDYVNEPVYGDELYALTVTKAEGIRENDQLAFLRAAGVQQHIAESLPMLGEMDSEYRYNIKVADKTGGMYRRISVEFTFVDAF